MWRETEAQREGDVIEVREEGVATSRGGCEQRFLNYNLEVNRIQTEKEARPQPQARPSIRITTVPEGVLSSSVTTLAFPPSGTPLTSVCA